MYLETFYLRITYLSYKKSHTYNILVLSKLSKTWEMWTAESDFVQFFQFAEQLQWLSFIPISTPIAHGIAISYCLKFK